MRPACVAAALSSAFLLVGPVVRADDGGAAAVEATTASETSPTATTPPSPTATLRASDEHQAFLGWHPSGAVHYLTLLDATKKLAGVRVCRERSDEVPAAWPSAVKLDAGVLCVLLDEATLGGPVAPFAMGELGGSKPLKVAPWGLKVELATTTEGSVTSHALVVVDPGTKDRSLPLPLVVADEAMKLGDVVWRADGASVAIALQSGKPAPGTAGRRLIVVADVGALLRGGGAAGRKVAMAREKEAAALMKKRDWSGAGRVLDDALVADPTFAAARYARAAAEAQGGIGRTAMIENLTWLKQAAATDPTAKKLLDGARKDPAFDAWCGEPEVRELLGLPSVTTMDVPARLTERAATWTLQGASCRTPWVTLVFSAGKAGKEGRITGQGSLEFAESCKGEKKKQKQPLSWSQTTTGTFEIATAPIEVSGLALPAKATLVLDETHQQLKLAPDGGEPIGTFEPGRALLDDSVL